MTWNTGTIEFPSADTSGAALTILTLTPDIHHLSFVLPLLLVTPKRPSMQHPKDYVYFNHKTFTPMAAPWQTTTPPSPALPIYFLPHSRCTPGVFWCISFGAAILSVGARRRRAHGHY